MVLFIIIDHIWMIVVELNICLFKMTNLKSEKFERNHDKVTTELNKKKDRKKYQ